MKAIAQDVYGSEDVLQYRDVERPKVGEKDVLVRVRAAGFDPGVWHFMHGKPYLMRPFSGWRRPRVAVRGMDLAGTVEAVGPGVTRFRAGDEVFGVGMGSYAEFAVAAEDKLALKPANLGFTEAAAVPISACTALQALRDQGRVAPGQRVLVLGASGGVGSFAVQLAKAFGAEVTGVSSAAKADFVRSLGADEVIDYATAQLARQAGRYDLIIDTGGNRPVAELRRLLTPRGTLVIVGGEGHGGDLFGGVGRMLGAVLLSPFVGHRLLGLFSIARHDDLLLLKGLIEADRLSPRVDATFPLAEAARAVAYWSAGRVRGKVVVTV